MLTTRLLDTYCSGAGWPLKKNKDHSVFPDLLPYRIHVFKEEWFTYDFLVLVQPLAYLLGALAALAAVKQIVFPAGPTWLRLRSFIEVVRRFFQESRNCCYRDPPAHQLPPTWRVARIEGDQPKIMKNRPWNHKKSNFYET